MPEIVKSIEKVQANIDIDEIVSHVTDMPEIQFSDGVYKGDIDNDSLPQGYGIFRNESKTVYIFTTDSVNQIGYGIINWANGRHFIGDLQDFIPHGFGKVTRENNENYANWD